MFKLVIAYVDPDVFEAIRQDLIGEGVVAISASSAGGPTPDQFVARSFRGTSQTYHLAEKIRIECVVGASHADAVQQTILAHPARRPTFTFVMDVSGVTPVDSVLLDAEDAL